MIVPLIPVFTECSVEDGGRFAPIDGDDEEVVWLTDVWRGGGGGGFIFGVMDGGRAETAVAMMRSVMGNLLEVDASSPVASLMN